MTYAVVFTVAFLASGLTFFSGFGLGTLLLPAFALFFPVEHAVALTAVVYFLNGLLKLALVGRRADLGIVLRFGIPAIAASFLGAWVLLSLSGVEPLVTYTLWGRTMKVTPVEFVVGLVLLLSSLAGLLPAFRQLSFSPKYLPLGGALSGFFGGLSGMQGALRSAFLAKVNVRKDVFFATGAVVATLIDERAEREILVDLCARLDMEGVVSIEAAERAVRALNVPGVGGYVRRWLDRQRRVLGRSEVGRPEVEAAVDRALVQRRRVARGDGSGLGAMTVHSSKNREFDGVIVLWPYTVAGDALQKARLLYTAITRARLWCQVLVQGRELRAAAPFV